MLISHDRTFCEAVRATHVGYLAEGTPDYLLITLYWLLDESSMLILSVDGGLMMSYNGCLMSR